MCEFTLAKVSAIEWLKQHYPALCVKAGLCEKIGGRLYTISALAQLSTQPVQQAGHVPTGWKLVPVEPTPEMIEAGANADPERESVWAAYIAAAPQPGEPDQSAWTVSHNGKTITAETLSKAMVAARGLRSEDEAAIAAQNLKRAIEEELAASEFLGADDMRALRRFDECCEDPDSGGHDVPKGTMRRLAEIGVVRSVGFGRHEMTAFGRHVLEIHAGEQPTLPLTTYQDACAIAAAAIGESMQTEKG